MLTEIEYIGKRYDNNICDYCDQMKKYQVNLLENIKCKNCDTILFPENMKLYLCGSRCEKTLWKTHKYHTPNKHKNINMISQYKDKKCDNCNFIGSYDGNFSGCLLE